MAQSDGFMITGLKSLLLLGILQASCLLHVFHSLQHATSKRGALGEENK